MFYDDTFTVLKKVCLEFCERLEKEKLDLSYVVYVRGDCFSDDLAKALKSQVVIKCLWGLRLGVQKLQKESESQLKSRDIRKL